VGTECVILAAGSSTRFGAPKALARFKNRNLLETAIDAATASICKNVNVVLGANQRTIEDNVQLAAVNVIENAHFEAGMSSSIICAVEALSSANAILFMTTDQPLITTTHLNALVNCFIQNGDIPIAAAFANDFGIPAVIPEKLFPQLLKLSGDRGAKSVLQKNAIKSIPIPAAEFDIDTPEDLLKLQQR